MNEKDKGTTRLYTEEQVNKIIELARFTYTSEDNILASFTPIELPSDEEIEKEFIDLLYDYEYEEIPNSAIYKFDYEGCVKALTKWYREQLKQRQ